MRVGSKRLSDKPRRPSYEAPEDYDYPCLAWHGETKTLFKYIARVLPGEKGILFDLNIIKIDTSFILERAPENL